MKFETARIHFLGIGVTFFAAKLPIILYRAPPFSRNIR